MTIRLMEKYSRRYDDVTNRNSYIGNFFKVPAGADPPRSDEKAGHQRILFMSLGNYTLCASLRYFQKPTHEQPSDTHTHTTVRKYGVDALLGITHIVNVQIDWISSYLIDVRI